MDLIRLDRHTYRNPDKDHRQAEYLVKAIDEYSDPEYSILTVTFEDFGLGEDRRSTFEVQMNWDDVKRFLSKFMELRHPEADYLHRMITLAQAIERAGWEPSFPGPAEFWDRFPPPQSK